MKIITVIKTLTLALILSGCGKGMISLQDELTAQEQLQMEKEELKEFIQVQNCAGNEVFNVDINIEETYDLCAVRKRYTGQSVGYEDVTWSIYDSESIGVLSSYYGPMTTFTALASGESRILASATTLLFDLSLIHI